MNCLCCNKKIEDTKSINGWHTSCIRTFFGTNTFPDIDLDKKTLDKLANESVNKGYTIMGVQKKLSLHLDNINAPRLTLVNFPSGYILKPSVPEYKFLPESEWITMKLAEITGIKVVPSGLIKVNGEYAYITKRVDRAFKRDKIYDFYAMEDFCQLDYRLTEDKYHGSYERCAKIIDKHSEYKKYDLSEFFLRLVFSFTVGNSDMHLKNFSLRENEPGSAIYNLSSAYDLLPVNIILPADTEEFALTMCGKKKNIDRKVFIEFAKTISLDEKVTNSIIDKVVSLNDKYFSIIDGFRFDEKFCDEYKKLIENRINKLCVL